MYIDNWHLSFNGTIQYVHLIVLCVHSQQKIYLFSSHPNRYGWFCCLISIHLPKHFPVYQISYNSYSTSIVYYMPIFGSFLIIPHTSVLSWVWDALSMVIGRCQPRELYPKNRRIWRSKPAWTIIFVALVEYWDCK